MLSSFQMSLEYHMCFKQLSATHVSNNNCQKIELSISQYAQESKSDSSDTRPG